MALNVKYRDFRYVIPFVVQFGLFISPVDFQQRGYPGQTAPALFAEPIVGVIGGFRSAIFRGASGIYLPGFALSMLVVTLFLFLGIGIFAGRRRPLRM
jgi:lipopolysaccharide transport system permease protein